MSQPLNAEHSQSANSPNSLSAAPEQGNTPADVGGIRCWRYSPETLQEERELLKKYHVEDFRGLLNETNMMLIGLIKLMQSINPNTRMRGYVIFSLGKLLGQVSTLVVRMRDVYGNVKHV